jgi:hypothetical protein
VVATDDTDDTDDGECQATDDTDDTDTSRRARPAYVHPPAERSAARPMAAPRTLPAVCALSQA